MYRVKCSKLGDETVGRSALALRTARSARAAAPGLGLDPQDLAGADRRAAVRDVECAVRTDCDRSGSGQPVDDGGSRSIRRHLEQPSGQGEEDWARGVV